MRKKSDRTSKSSQELAKRMKYFRELAGLSQKEAANLIEVSESTYSDWEHGKTILGEPYPAMAKAYKISLNTLFGLDENENKSVDDKFNQIITDLIILKDQIAKKSDPAN